MIRNVEIKARCNHPAKVRNYLLAEKAVFRGTDHQRDTYFKVSKGRLKLRQGNIENALIYYNRPNISGPKISDISLSPVTHGPALEELLQKALGTRIIVDKKREIYFIGNVKFHIDKVEGLGSFVEIEAIDNDGTIGIDTLRQQCDFYLKAFDISSEDLLSNSYSDMLELLTEKPDNH